MKKSALSALLLLFAVVANSQDKKHLDFFPNTGGSKMIVKSYDALNDLKGVMILSVEQPYSYGETQPVELTMVLHDGEETVIHEGSVSARYDHGDFMLDCRNLAILPCIARHLSPENEITDAELYYPNTYLVTLLPEKDKHKMSRGAFEIRQRQSGRPVARVEIDNRCFERQEKLMTPAGKFAASRLEYDMTVSDAEGSENYRIKEWHAPGAGMVRCEVYNKEGVLEDYTVLTSLSRR